MTDLELFNILPEEYKNAVNFIIENVLGDESPEMNDAFREWQAGIFSAGATAEDERPDLKVLEIEAFAFREGWDGRGNLGGVPA